MKKKKLKVKKKESEEEKCPYFLIEWVFSFLSWLGFEPKTLYTHRPLMKG